MPIPLIPSPLNPNKTERQEELKSPEELNSPINWRIYLKQEDENANNSAAKFRSMIENPECCPPWRNFRNRYYSNQDDLNKIYLDTRVLEEISYDKRDEGYVANDDVVNMVNLSLYLRRPLLVTGSPGVGKSSLIYSVAKQLNLGPVLKWSINSRTVKQEGLYNYDAIARFQSQSQSSEFLSKDRKNRKTTSEKNDIGDYLTLGPLGTALLPWSQPRALLIDEIDKGDIDLANDLLDILEEGRFVIPELARIAKRDNFDEVEVPTADGYKQTAKIIEGVVKCLHFPFVVLTSNDERQFSAAFNRRCLHLRVNEPDTNEELWRIVQSHLANISQQKFEYVIKRFRELRDQGKKPNDQLLQAIFLLTRVDGNQDEFFKNIDSLFKSLSKQ